MNSFFLIENFQIARFRERSQNAEIKKTQLFEISINREPSQFEYVKMEMAVQHNEMMNPEIENAIRRADSAFDFDRGRSRRRSRPFRRDRGGRGGRNERATHATDGRGRDDRGRNDRRKRNAADQAGEADEAD